MWKLGAAMQGGGLVLRRTGCWEDFRLVISEDDSGSKVDP